MKTLLQINVVVNRGSTGRIAEEIGQAAMAAGWKSYITYGWEHHVKSKSETIRIGKDINIKLHGLETRLLDNHALGISSRRATQNFIKEIERIQPDIIHLHNLHGYYINIEVLFDYLAKSNLPVVWTLHDCWTFTGHCSYFDWIDCNKWKTHCNSCPQKKGYPASYLVDRSKKNFKEKKSLLTAIKSMTMIPVSNWLGNYLKDSFLHKYPVEVIHNGIDTNIFNPNADKSILSKYNLENKFTVIGVAAVWSARKGLVDFIKLNEIFGNTVQIVLVGLSKKQIASLPDGVVGVERTESVEELAALYAFSDIFINPTYTDNFPTTNIEALASGTPVITYKTGGSPEAVDKKTGLIVEKGDVNSLMQAIEEVKTKGKAYYSQACVERAHNLYRKEDRYQDYIDLYNRMLAKS